MIGKLYYSHSTNRGSATFTELPFHDASIDWKRTEASTMSFRSPVKLAEADRIRYKSNTLDFGGQIYNIKKSVGDDYTYEVISYLRLYHDKVTCSFKNLTSSQILKKVLKLSRNNFSTSGIKKTSVIHSNVKWENTSIWDIAQQLCWLEHQAGYEVRAKVDANGTLLFNYIPKQQVGYSFTNVLDYEESYDSSDIITKFHITFDGKVVASASSSKDLIAKWGYVSDSEECESTSDTGSNSSSKLDVSLKNDAMIQKYNINSKVVNQALSIAKKGNSQYQNLKLLYEWCNKNIGYSSYANTKYKAEGTLSKRKGNCCDNAHLLIAMARSIGIKARYCHAKNGKGGHIYGEYYVKNKWIVVDTGTKSSSKYWNGHWNGFGGTKKRYETLPF
ncbi:transglutaminase-like domain-containing protein [Methanobrevibacter olleyae]|uniref:Transglutaminase domain-containing protein n=1 Tax=Methanobrevibacter olleyae TaxID=294671 RepID=A0A126R2P8_METOL|nr:transglutaminase-like domain-containing protein [Methanobrevibacter olleyae]AMK16328.1 transglutaminase domain-containing protein [Methanobrevibacter olleyae]